MECNPSVFLRGLQDRERDQRRSIPFAPESAGRKNSRIRAMNSARDASGYSVSKGMAERTIRASAEESDTAPANVTAATSLPVP